MQRRHLIAAVLILPLLLGATSEKCSPKKHSAAPLTSTINEDDGEHRIRNYGRFKFEKSLSPHRAGAACKWRIEAQWEGEQGRHRVDNGTETDKIYINKPSKESTKVWLISKSCGRFE